MRHIELAQQFAHHLRKVVIIGYMREITTVLCCQRRPVDTIHVGDIEPLRHFTHCEIIHRFTLGRGIDTQLTADFNRLDRLGSQIHLLQAAGANHKHSLSF